MNLPKFGLGCLKLDSMAESKEAIRLIHQAMELGIKLFDTAPIYGLGVSEYLLGKAIEGKRDKVLIATKTGLVWESNPWFRKYVDNSPETITLQLERSLKNLNTDYIDIYLLHYPDVLIPIEKTVECLLKFKKEEKVREIGYCNVPVCYLRKALDYDDVIVQVGYNLLNREAESELLPFCNDGRLKVMVHSPLASGKLRDKVLDAFRFVSSNKAISTILFGVTGTKQLVENVRILESLN